MARAKADNVTHLAELESLRSALHEARSSPSASDPSTLNLQQQIAELKEDLESTRESSHLTKQSLVEQIEMNQKNYERELEKARLGNVEEVERIRSEEEKMRKRLEEVVEREREAKNKGLVLCECGFGFSWLTPFLAFVSQRSPRCRTPARRLLVPEERLSLHRLCTRYMSK